MWFFEAWQQLNQFKEDLEGEAESCDVEPVKTGLVEEFELLRFSFNITDIKSFDLILEDFLLVLDIENYSKYAIIFLYLLSENLGPLWSKKLKCLTVESAEIGFQAWGI